MAVDYNDSRFQEVEEEKNQALQETQDTYNQMIDKSDAYYQQQIDASKDWANKQQELQQAQTDFAIEKVEQQKEQARKDYIKEQKGAYTDYQKASNQYGVNAERLAQNGLTNSGYSESTKTNMFNTYQNRYMAARESYNKAVLNYDNAIKDAQLANNSALAQIAYESLQKQLELSLQGFQYNNTLVLQKLQAINETKDRYHSRYQDVLNQINWERQFAASQARSSYGSGGSSSSYSTESLSDGSNESSGTLSKNGQLVLNQINNLYKLGNDEGDSTNAAIRYINNQYQKGNLTASDVRLIANNLNI